MAEQETKTLEQTPPAHHKYEWSARQDGRHKNSQEIEQDVDHTRHDMDTTLDALGNRLSPGHLIEYVYDYFQIPHDREHARKSAIELSNRIFQTIQENPFPSMLVGAGIGWIAWNMQPHDGRTGTEALHKGRHGIGKAFDTAKSTISSARESVEETIESARHGIGSAQAKTGEQADKFRERSEKFGTMAGKRREQTAEGYQRARDILQEYPLAAGVATMAAGIIAGLAFRPTHTEKRLMGEQAEKAKEKVTSQAKETAQKAEEATEKEMQKTEKSSENPPKQA
ncbi:MAG: DUF3618 domain-containing protein [Chitinivibrionales bacterium]|nr:DUF3618 domain-containing protein [Chitinivibrionales bacterium]